MRRLRDLSRGPSRSFCQFVIKIVLSQHLGQTFRRAIDEMTVNANNPLFPAAHGLSLRAEVSDDESFLCALYGSTRAEELEASGWDPTARAAFLSLQFKAQRAGYRSQFPQAECSIVLLEGSSIGRTVVNRTDGEIRLVDLVLLPERRGAGIGTILLSSLIAEAANLRQPLRLSVVKGSRAIRLYERLGFSKMAEHGFHHQMEWRFGRLDGPFLQPCD